MKIDAKTLEKLVWIIYKRFFIEKGKLKDIQINLDEIARSIKKISGDDKDPTSILDIDVEV